MPPEVGDSDTPMTRHHLPGALQGQGPHSRGVRLRDLAKPLGIADWETRLVDVLPDDLKGSLPTIEEIDAELNRADGEKDEVGTVTAQSW